jgi:hypothetical protein
MSKYRKKPVLVDAWQFTKENFLKVFHNGLKKIQET